MDVSSSVAVFMLVLVQLHQAQYYNQFRNFKSGTFSKQSRLQQLFSNNFFSRNSFFNNDRQTPPSITTTTTTTTTTQRPRSAVEEFSPQCGVRHSSYRPDQEARKGRIIWTDTSSAGANNAPDGSFPWLASLFLRRPETGEAYFMCAATILTPTVLVSAAHCFNSKYSDSDWFVRVGDNFIISKDPSEQTFQVNLIMKHEKFLPLSSPGGDGRNDIALLQIKRREGRSILFDKFVRPACLPHTDDKISRWRGSHCEISGWGMQEYNNTSSYPDSIRAAKIKIGVVNYGVCNYLYGRDVKKTGKFCAGGTVDACQEDSGGPLMCEHQGRYHLVGIVSSGKGCGLYPGLYTEVSKYSDWIVLTMRQLENVLES